MALRGHIRFLALVLLLVSPAGAHADDLLDQLRARQAAQRAAAGLTPAPAPSAPSLPMPAATPPGPPAVYTGELQRLEGCTLAANAANDGDSFHVLHQGRELLFRLYFVDTPETDLSFPERVAEQAEYFKVTSPVAIRIGLDAEHFTASALGSRPFTVWTVWRDARGRSKLPRFYAFVVFTGPGSRKTDLAEALVGAGLARIHGLTSVTPEGVRAAAYEIKLSALEREAQGQRRGGWAGAK